jgi:16S rRNA (cytosine967-C5)-methyltransferase
LEKAVALARPGTKILYSTCSIQPEENTEQIRVFLKKHPNFTLIAEKLTLPTMKTADAFDQDGGYATVIQTR